MTRLFKKVSKEKCSLGEGLYCDLNIIAWVDINNNKVFVSHSGRLDSYKLSVKPTVIFNCKESKLKIGTDKGLLFLDYVSNMEKLENWELAPHDLKHFRTNDGSFGKKHALIGFMHRNRPEKYEGSICRINGNALTVIDNGIHIPNGFIWLNETQILICDSLTSVVYLYTLDEMGSVTDKRLFHKYESSVSPDGGCIVGKNIWFALWDGAALSCLDIKTGEEINRISVPCIRPTNCKYDFRNNKMIFTSASFDADKESGDQGFTQLFDLSIN